ncbi:MAG: YbaK/EbsC family protein [Ilumatobacteraceae bacterium]|nr:YbaK/EbsC family protein [Ilumatobacteraceae bacterium]
MTEVHVNVLRVIEAAAALGLNITPQTFPDGTRTAQEAADAIGVQVGQIVKSLIFAVDGEVVLAYVSGANQLDESKLALAAGGAICQRVDAHVVRSVTGFPIGGVPPFGHSTQLRIFIDPDLLKFDEVWAAAGTWHDVFAIDPRVLQSVTNGVVVELRRTP